MQLTPSNKQTRVKTRQIAATGPSDCLPDSCMMAQRVGYVNARRLLLIMLPRARLCLCDPRQASIEHLLQIQIDSMGVVLII